MSEEENERDFMKACFNVVAGLEVKNESQAIAKEAILEEVEWLQQKIDKANNELITLIQIIMQQPSKNVEEDNYLLSRLESISNILVGEDNE